VPARLLWLPLWVVNLVSLVNIEPQLFVVIVAHALVLLVEAVEGATYDVILSLDGCPLQFDPLAVLDELENVGARPNAVWQPRDCVSNQAEQSHDRWALALELGVLSGLIVYLLVLFLDHRGHK